ncbi:unknown [Feldmannia species virus]|uniref:Ankyrin repeat protein n=1 Tax=Feldmannia species virus TaxID=39420 RepID=B5LWN1_9PHYC|nr:hypothetical protein FeldSpV_gp142 [Feldmannia species virus]ACH46894.1 unknown [Feldmannia species virus]
MIGDDASNEVLNFVGEGSYLFTAVVCRAWNRSYTLRKETNPVEALTSVNRAIDTGVESLGGTRCWYSAVAVEDNVEVLEWLLHRGLEWGPFIMCPAGYAGHISNVAWLMDKLPAETWTRNDGVLNSTVNGGSVPVVQLLVSQGCAPTAAHVGLAARAGHRELLLWLVTQVGPLDTVTFSHAVLNFGATDTSCLQELKNVGCPWSSRTSAVAVRTSPKFVMIWLWDNGCPFGDSATANAVTVEDYEKLGWLLDHGCPYDPATMIDELVLRREWDRLARISSWFKNYSRSS